MAQPYNPYAPQPGQQVGRFGGSQGSGLGGRLGVGGGIGAAAQGIIQQGGQAGYFSPTGSPQLLAAVRQMALRNSMNQQHRGALLSRLLGLDPQQARAAQLGFEQQGGSDISNALLGAGTQQLTGSQDWIRQLFGQQLQGAQQLQQAQAMAKAQQQGGIGSFLGQIAGGVAPWALGKLTAPRQRSTSNADYSGQPMTGADFMSQYG